MNVSLKNKVKEHLIMLYRITLVLGTTTLLFVVFKTVHKINEKHV